MDTPLITNEDIAQMASSPTLGPGWSASRRIADKLMRDWADDRFKALIDEFSKRFNEHLWDDVQSSLQSDVEFNIGGHIRQMVDETVSALLTGQPWAMQRYPLSKLYDAESIRAAVAEHIPAELQDARIADLEAANKRMADTIETLRRYPLTGRELREIRRAVGMTQDAFLRALGMLPDRLCETADDHMRRLNAKGRLRKMERCSAVAGDVAAKARAMMEGR